MMFSCQLKWDQQSELEKAKNIVSLIGLSVAPAGRSRSRLSDAPRGPQDHCSRYARLDANVLCGCWRGGARQSGGAWGEAAAGRADTEVCTGARAVSLRIPGPLAERLDDFLEGQLSRVPRLDS